MRSFQFLAGEIAPTHDLPAAVVYTSDLGIAPRLHASETGTSLIYRHRGSANNSPRTG